MAAIRHVVSDRDEQAVAFLHEPDLTGMLRIRYRRVVVMDG
jgi:hypothetical protein